MVVHLAPLYTHAMSSTSFLSDLLFGPIQALCWLYMGLQCQVGTLGIRNNMTMIKMNMIMCMMMMIIFMIVMLMIMMMMMIKIMILMIIIIKILMTIMIK